MRRSSGRGLIFLRFHRFWFIEVLHIVKFPYKRVRHEENVKCVVPAAYQITNLLWFCAYKY